MYLKFVPTFSVEAYSQLNTSSHSSIYCCRPSLKVYEKSGPSGRAELSAFFLEDLLNPMMDSNSIQGKQGNTPLWTHSSQKEEAGSRYRQRGEPSRVVKTLT